MFPSKKSQVFILASIIIIISVSSIVASQNLLNKAKSFDRNIFFAENLYLDLKDAYRFLVFAEDENEIFNLYNSITLNQLEKLKENYLNDELFVIVAYRNKFFVYNYFKTNVKIIAKDYSNYTYEFLLSPSEILMINSFEEIQIFDEDLFIGSYSMINPVIILNKDSD